MKTLITALLLVTIASPALAARSSKYDDSYDTGASARVSKGYIGIAGGKNTIAASDTTTYAASTASTIFGGYSFNNFVSAELAYTNLGTGETDPVSTNTTAGSVMSLSAVGSLPIGKVFSLFAKVGYAQSKLDATESTTATTVSETNSGAIYGAGAQFNVGQRVGIRLGYEHFNVGSTTSVGSSLVSAGVLFKF